jgi:cell division protein FtsZ
MGTGEADGDERAIQAAEKAIANPLLDEISLKGAKGVLINITGGHDLTLFELDEAANRIREEVDPDANIIVGSTLDEGMEGMMRVSVVATGIDASTVHADIPVPRRSLAEPLKPAAVEAPAAAAPAAATTFEAPAAPVAAEAAEEPSLFDDAQTSEAEPSVPSFFDHQQSAPAKPAAQAQDDLPPPAYQPAATPEPQPAQPEAFVAPRAPAPGTPSQDALARLRAAAAKTRQDGAQDDDNVAEERPRGSAFNNLIGRMTGHHNHQEAAPQRRAASFGAPAAAPTPSPAPAPQAQQDPDQERIEIPAFLRRQAN